MAKYYLERIVDMTGAQTSLGPVVEIFAGWLMMNGPSMCFGRIHRRSIGMNQVLGNDSGVGRWFVSRLAE